MSRTKRLADLADLMLKLPGGTLPQKLNEPVDLKALYRLMSAPGVTHEAVFASRAAPAREVAGQHGGTVLLVHDTTKPNWSIQDFHFAVARLGGHRNRRGDHPPAGSCSGAAGPNSKPWSTARNSNADDARNLGKLQEG